MREEEHSIRAKFSNMRMGGIGSIGAVTKILYPGNKLRINFSWSYSGPAGTYYAMVQLGNANVGLPFSAIAKGPIMAFLTSQTSIAIDIPITTSTPEGIYEVEADICSDASGMDQSIIAYVQGPLNDIQVTREAIFENLAVTYSIVP